MEKYVKLINDYSSYKSFDARSSLAVSENYWRLKQAFEHNMGCEIFEKAYNILTEIVFSRIFFKKHKSYRKFIFIYY